MWPPWVQVRRQVTGDVYRHVNFIICMSSKMQIVEWTQTCASRPVSRYEGPAWLVKLWNSKHSCTTTHVSRGLEIFPAHTRFYNISLLWNQGWKQKVWPLRVQRFPQCMVMEEASYRLCLQVNKNIHGNYRYLIAQWSGDVQSEESCISHAIYWCWSKPVVHTAPVMQGGTGDATANTLSASAQIFLSAAHGQPITCPTLE